ncbi:LysR family transcriptional regulator [Pseudobacter ginsenosidimutans]|uniref:DNA-binding transcriptional LysR family regulator n=1 Tax=Pseudobacter ginsenosidimutans TaxID=661488 RepID=A0A4Q7N690_9BACT|nr:LysR family transcriptional regulator [Pseudobacter ginsenosidimutans]QEC45084.1 LysR family transcriptional regulator [Pseudobacter ginsenosidimutans]RZS76579.1 DNA-binding transcriptional LysR family regulator [Pseudobacter ginsenosidimutans]
MTINLEWLRTFKAIYELGTLTSAAEALFISQPGVSLHLNSLEGFTGYKLFDRSAKRMVPTERGKVLYNFIIEPIDKLLSVEQVFGRSTQAERSTISVGMCFETFQYTLEEHISKLPFNLIIKFGEYPQMIHDLDKGVLDLIVTPHKADQKNLEYQAFSSERIVLVSGAKLDAKPFHKFIKEKNLKEAANWLKKQLWYSTAADMEHLKRFWQLNFRYHMDFKPNYIVPNISSIVRCLRNGNGISVIPDFLCREEMRSGELKLLWEGENKIENTLYFGTRKKTIYTNEVNQIKKIFAQKMT